MKNGINTGFSATKLELIYRGTRDGFKGEAFHQNCDFQGGTLSIIKSEMGKIFGGYTDIPWQSPENYGCKEGHGNSFIFSLADN